MATTRTHATAMHSDVGDRHAAVAQARAMHTQEEEEQDTRQTTSLLRPKCTSVLLPCQHSQPQHLRVWLFISPRKGHQINAPTRKPADIFTGRTTTVNVHGPRALSCRHAHNPEWAAQLVAAQPWPLSHIVAGCPQENSTQIC